LRRRAREGRVRAEAGDAGCRTEQRDRGEQFRGHPSARSRRTQNAVLELSHRVFSPSRKVQVETLPAPAIGPDDQALYPQLLSNRATFDVVETRAWTIV